MAGPQMTLEQRVKGLEGRMRSLSLALIFFVGVGLASLGVNVAVITKFDARDKREDARAAEQRMIQHECSVPPLPGQHKPEPRQHVHECWDEGMGRILIAMQEQAAIAAATGKHTETIVNHLNSPERQRIIADTLARIQRQTEEVLSRTTFVVTNPNRPTDAPLTVTPVIAPPGAPSPQPTPCAPLVGVGETAIGQGLVCKR